MEGDQEGGMEGDQERSQEERHLKPLKQKRWKID
jgi:hypothetical protein